MIHYISSFVSYLKTTSGSHRDVLTIMYHSSFERVAANQFPIKKIFFSLFHLYVGLPKQLVLSTVVMTSERMKDWYS